MTAFFKRFILAVQFLTVVTVWPRLKADGRDLAGTVPFFPVVGLMLGCGLAYGHVGLGLVFPPLLTDALIVAFWIFLTRGLHLEGVADCADGLIGGYTKQRALEIMKDSNSGAFAIMAVALVILIKWAALMSLAGSMKWTALLIAPVIGRTVMALIMYLSDYARPEGGLGKSFVDEIRTWEAAVAALLGLAAGILILGRLGAFLFVGCFIYAWFLKWYFNKRISGITGDGIGASGETAELLTLLALAAYGI